MNENCVFFHGSKVGKLVFFDVGPGVITGLKQVSADIFKILWSHNVNKIHRFYHLISAAVAKYLALIRAGSCVFGLIKATHTKIICSLCESSIYFPSSSGRTTLSR